MDKSLREIDESERDKVEHAEKPTDRSSLLIHHICAQLPARVTAR